MRRGGMMAGSWSSIIFAAKEGNDSLVEALLARQNDVNSLETDKHYAGFTPLMWAAFRGHFATVELLLSRGASTEPEGLPPMTSACGGAGPHDAETWASRKGFTGISLAIQRARMSRAQIVR